MTCLEEYFSDMGFLSWLARRNSGSKFPRGIPCLKFSRRDDKEENCDKNLKDSIESLKSSFDDICFPSTSGESKGESKDIIKSRKISELTYREVSSRRKRAATMPAEMPSMYGYDVKTEVEMHAFRKNRRGGICADNVQEYYRSWNTRNHSV